MWDLLASDRREFFGRLGAALVISGATPVLMAKSDSHHSAQFEPAPPIKIPAAVAKEEELPEDVSNREALRWALQYLERRITVPMRSISDDGGRRRYFVNSRMNGVVCLAASVGMEHGTALEITTEIMKGLETLALLINGGEQTLSMPMERPLAGDYQGVESGPKVHLRMMKVYDVVRNQIVVNFSVLTANEEYVNG